MESRENLLQLTQAMARHITLHAMASNKVRYPAGREKSTAAGLKTRATTSNAAVVVWAVPVGFWHASNMATSRLC
jgi:hypothetical protein